MYFRNKKTPHLVESNKNSADFSSKYDFFNRDQGGSSPSSVVYKKQFRIISDVDNLVTHSISDDDGASPYFCQENNESKIGKGF